jgi:hypothetical protein
MITTYETGHGFPSRDDALEELFVELLDIQA